MSDIIARAETTIRFSDQSRIPPHIIGMLAELVKELKDTREENKTLRLDRNALADD